jgi:hypothetical protein
MVTFPVPPVEKLAEAKAKNAFLERQGVTRHGFKFFRSGTPLLPAEVDALQNDWFGEWERIKDRRIADERAACKFAQKEPARGRVTITAAAAADAYLEAAQRFNDEAAKGKVSDSLVRECARLAMMALYTYQLPENWDGGGPIVPLPVQLTNDIARNILVTLGGHIPTWMLHLQKTGAPRVDPKIAEKIGLAVAYKKLAAHGVIVDRQAAKTISGNFGVTRRQVQAWVKEYSWADPECFFPYSSSDRERASLIAADLPRAGEFYRDWGRGPKNPRPTGKAWKRRPTKTR